MRFVLLDRLLEIARGAHVRAEVTFPADLPIFDDHFPGRPLVPGVLLTESMCQAGGWLIAATGGFTEWPLLARIDRATFRRPVAPAEPLIITAHLGAARPGAYEVRAQMTSGAEEVASARFLYHATGLDGVAGSAAGPFAAWSQRTFEALGGPAALAAERHA